MKRYPVSLLVCVLALGPATQLLSACTGAIPGNQNPAILATNSTPDFRTANTALTSEQETGPAGNPAWQDNLPSGNNTCRQDLASGAPVVSSTTGMPCLNPADAQQRVSFLLGRRVGAGGDILGEFDGVRVDYRPGDGLNLKGIAGYPVVAAGDQFNTTRQVFGISAATKPFARAWDLNSYLIGQQVNGQAGGRSMGGALRYLQPGRSLLVYLDYDAAEHSLGTLMASGAWKLPFKTTINATLDRRNRPLTGRQQKYLQQSMKVTEGWNWILPSDRLAHHTGDGSGEVSTLAVGLSHALSQRIKLSSDFAVLDTMNDTIVDAATTDRSSEYFYHLKLTGKDLVIPGDSSKFDLRHNVTETGRTTTAAIDTKYAINRFWNVMPKLRADYTSPLLENSPQWVASPAVKMEYRRNELFGFQIEAGGKWSTGADSTADDSGSSYFMNMKYQAKF
jgi:hypothetical protein